MSYYDEPSDQMEESKEITAHFGDRQPLRIPGSKMQSDEKNPPIMHAMKLHQQLSEEKNREMMKVDEIFAAQV